VLSHIGDQSDTTVALADRTLGDLVMPQRTASAMRVVNESSRGIGSDAADWSVYRCVRFAHGLREERRQMSG